MRSRNLFAFGLIVVGLSVSAAHGQLLVERFTYANGALDGNGVDGSHIWANHSGTVNQLQVTGGAAQVVQATNTEDSSVPLGVTLGAGGKLYAALDVTVTASGALSGTSPAYFVHFRDSGTANFASRVFAAPSTVGGDFTYGIRSFSGTGPAVSWASGFTLGTTQRLVFSYEFNTGLSELWVNPATQASTSISDTNASAASFAMQFLALREAAYSTANGVKEAVDNLCVDTTFNGALNCVPEPTSLALLSLGGLALIRRRR